MICKDCQKSIEYMGDSIYPYYGMAPHTHDLSSGTYIGSTRLSSQQNLPPNFEPDPDSEDSFGQYWQGLWYCPTDGCEFSRNPKELKNEPA